MVEGYTYPTIEYDGSSESAPHSVICLASTSPSRLEGMQFCHPGVNVRTLPGGDEPRIDDTVTIAKGKIDFVMGELNNRGDHGLPVIGADTMAFCFTQDVKGGEHIKLGGHGKTPLSDVAEILRQMQEINQRDPHIPLIWAVDTGAAVYRPRADKVETNRHIAWAELDPIWVENFLTGDGAERYLRIYRAAKELPPLSLFLPPDHESVSGGLAFEPLFIGRAIQRINGVWVAGANPRQLRESLGVSICVGGVGLPPKPSCYSTEVLTKWGKVSEAADCLLRLRE